MDEVTVTDSKNNKKIVDGMMEGFVIKRVPERAGIFQSRRPIYFDEMWSGKRVLCILLEKPDI